MRIRHSGPTNTVSSRIPLCTPALAFDAFGVRGSGLCPRTLLAAELCFCPAPIRSKPRNPTPSGGGWVLRLCGADFESSTTLLPRRDGKADGRDLRIAALVHTCNGPVSPRAIPDTFSHQLPPSRRIQESPDEDGGRPAEGLRGGRAGPNHPPTAYRRPVGRR